MNGYMTTKIGNASAYVFPAQPQLTSALVPGTVYTSLAVTPLPAPVYAGQVVVTVFGGSGGNTQGWTVSANTAAGATAIPVLSQAASFAFPDGLPELTSALSGGTTYTALPVSVVGNGLQLGQNVILTSGGSTQEWTVGNTLTSALIAGTVYTSLAVTALAGPLGSGAKFTVAYGEISQTWTTSSAVTAGAPSIPVVSQAAGFACPIGATVNVSVPMGTMSIPVISQAANATYPVGSVVSGPAISNTSGGTIVSGAAASVPGVGISMWRQAQVLTSALAEGTDYTSLPCTAFLPNLSGVAQQGAQVTVIQPGPLPVLFQRWVLSGAVTAGAGTTSLPVVSQAAEAAFPAGSLAGIWMPL
jgi:hypothetical protein